MCGREGSPVGIRYLSMAFAQLTYRDGLRDIEACLRSLGGEALPYGFFTVRCRVPLWPMPTNARLPRIYADFAQVLIRLRPTALRGGSNRRRVAAEACTLWTRPRSICAFLGCFLGRIPEAQGRCQDAHAAGPAREHPHLCQHYCRQSTRRQYSRRDSAGAWGVLCHGPRLRRFPAPYAFVLSAAFFCRPHQIQRSAPSSAATHIRVDRTTGKARSDHTVILTAIGSAKVYPDALRRVSLLMWKPESGSNSTTNNFALPAFTIAQIYSAPLAGRTVLQVD